MGTRRAVILIPGLFSVEHGANLKLLVDGLVSGTGQLSAALTESQPALGPIGKQLSCTNTANGATWELDLYEVPYTDLLPKSETMSHVERLKAGTRLILYWTFSGIWRKLFTGKYVAISLISSSVLLVLWYVGVVVVSLTTVERLVTSREDMLYPYAAAIGNWATWFAKSEFWLVVLGLLGMLGTARLVNLSNCARIFLSDDHTRSAIRHRVLSLVNASLREESYAAVVLVGFSFGVVVAAESLARLKHQRVGDVRFVSLGGSLGSLSAARPALDALLHDCASNPAVDRWIDFNSDGDFFCSPPTFDTPPTKFIPQPLPRLGSPIDQFLGRTHTDYFSVPEVLDAIAIP